MREIEHHLDAIEAGIAGTIEDYERSDTGAFFAPERKSKPGPQSRPQPRPQQPKPGERKLDDETGLAEITTLASGEIDLTEHPAGEIVVDQGADALLDNLDPHYLAIAIEITRLAAEELESDGPDVA